MIEEYLKPSSNRGLESFLLSRLALDQRQQFNNNDSSIQHIWKGGKKMRREKFEIWIEEKIKKKFEFLFLKVNFFLHFLSTISSTK